MHKIFYSKNLYIKIVQLRTDHGILDRMSLKILLFVIKSSGVNQYRLHLARICSGRGTAISNSTLKLEVYAYLFLPYLDHQM